MKIQSAPLPLAPHKITEHPTGMILAFSLLVLLLVSLMGLAIISNTKTELNISSNTTSGRDTFIHTDAASQITTFFGHCVLASADLGSVFDNDNSDSPMTMDISDNFNSSWLVDTFYNDQQEPDATPVTRRYLQVGTNIEGRDPNLAPHIIFKTKGKDSNPDRIFATSALAVDNRELSSLDPNADVILTTVATTIGRNTRTQANISSYNEDGGPPGDNLQTEDGPYSIITTIFRVVL